MGSNKDIQERYKKHKCLTCNNISYWDMYLCKKRPFKFYDYGILHYIRAFVHWYKWYVSPDISFFRFLKDELYNNFIPRKPIKRCNKYVPKTWDKFWIDKE